MPFAGAKMPSGERKTIFVTKGADGNSAHMWAVVRSERGIVGWPENFRPRSIPDRRHGIVVGFQHDQQFGDGHDFLRDGVSNSVSPPEQGPCQAMASRESRRSALVVGMNYRLAAVPVANCEVFWERRAVRLRIWKAIGNAVAGVVTASHHAE